MKRLHETAILLAGLLLAASVATAQTPNAEDVLRDAGFDASAKKKILAGEIVQVSAKPSNDRELSISLAFLVKDAPDTFLAEVLDGLVMRSDPDAKAFGDFEGEPTVAQLAKLSLSADEVKSWLEAEPGGDVNLSQEEHAKMAALREKGAKPAEVEAAVRQILVDRVIAYQKGGLDGIAPYDLGGGDTRDGGSDLKKASGAQVASRKRAPAFYKVLTTYPAAKPDKEVFRWSSYTAHGTPVVILTHGMAVEVGDAVGVVQRQFFVSGSYNVEQAVAGFFPVKEGTLVVYTNRTSTDQVAGFGGGSKRAIGRKLMSSQLSDLYGKVRTSAKQ